MLRSRGSMEPGEAAEKSRVIRERFMSLNWLLRYSCFLLYLPLGNEVDTWRILDELLSRDKEVYAPCCHGSEPGRMEFYRVMGRWELSPGFCGIPEPHPGKAEAFLNHVPSVAVVPGVAFDESGYRLGFGQGFYDRYFQGLAGPAPVLAGLAYEFQVFPALSPDEWDVPMHLIITENRVIQTR